MLRPAMAKIGRPLAAESSLAAAKFAAATLLLAESAAFCDQAISELNPAVPKATQAAKIRIRLRIWLVELYVLTFINMDRMKIQKANLIRLL